MAEETDLAVIFERIKNLDNKFDIYHKESQRNNLEIKTQIETYQRETKAEIEELRTELKAGYVSKEVFDAVLSPIQKIVYGLVGAVLLTIATALIGLVVVGS